MVIRIPHLDGHLTSTTPAQQDENGVREILRPRCRCNFVSSDNVVFKIHGNQLTTHSAGFAIQDNTSVGTEPVHLQESSAILEILFQFIQSPSEVELYRQPSVIDTNPDIFFAVAEAAEKYIVHGAMNIFVTRMHSLLGNHSVDVLNHSGKHGYNELANQAAEQTLINCSYTVMASKLTAPGLLTKWIKYCDSFLAMGKLGDQAFMGHNSSTCLLLLHKHILYLRQVATSPRLVATFPPGPAGMNCSTGSIRCPCHAIEQWFTNFHTRVNYFPKFSDIAD